MTPPPNSPDERVRRSLDQHFTVAAEAHEYRFATGSGRLRLHKQSARHGCDYWMGEFLDPRGTVTVYRQSDYTRLDFVVDGTVHVRCWQKFWGDRTIARLARAFITDLRAKALGTPPHE